MPLIKRAFLEWKVYGAVCIDTAVELMGEGYVVQRLENRWERKHV